MPSLWRLVFIISIWFLLVGCQTTSAPEVTTEPTIAPTATEVLDLESAELVAREFLEAWRLRDFDRMYDLLSFASQEVTPLPQFRLLYEEAQRDMTLETIEYTPITLQRDTSSLVSFHYDLVFKTAIMGDINDPERNLNLIDDPQAETWRVAWSPNDILTGMSAGAVLDFEARIPSRANIYDRNGLVLADQNGAIIHINVIQDRIPEYETCITDLATVLEEDETDISDKIQAVRSDWVVDVGVVEPTIFTENQLQLEAVCEATFVKQNTRRYPRGTLMPHILGHVGYPDPEEVDDLEVLGFTQDTIIGRSGIEAAWDETLRGSPGGRLVLKSIDGTVLRTLAEVEPVPAKSIWLTIDAKLQEYVVNMMAEAYASASGLWGLTSEGAATVVLDVNTGEILAMVSYPTFDGNAFNAFPSMGQEAATQVLVALNEDPRAPQLNRPTQGVLQTGSAMKVVGSFAVVDSGVYTLDQTYLCTGYWQLGNDIRYDWSPTGHGRVDIASALTRSCNSFYYEAGYRMFLTDPYLFPQYAKRMGMGNGSGLEDIGEARGTIPDPDWQLEVRGEQWTYSHAITMAIGQGDVKVTPLQLARTYAAIANNGSLLRPQLVREVGILDDREFEAETEVMDKWNFINGAMQKVQQGLCNVTTATDGTAYYVFRDSPVQSVGVCGKTGTAQTGGANDPPHAWFVGYAPSDVPEVVVLVVVEKAGEGSQVAAPLVRQIMERYFFWTIRLRIIMRTRSAMVGVIVLVLITLFIVINLSAPGTSSAIINTCLQKADETCVQLPQITTENLDGKTLTFPR